jgi:regulator of cell morphogenesis and NO signaling
MTTSTPSLAERHVGDIAVALPGATAVFRRFKLDFCCGGDIPLAQAAANRNVSLADLVAALEDLDATPGTGTPAETPALIEHIVTRYHVVHRRELSELIRLAKRVEIVHGDHVHAPHGMASLLSEIAEELEDHMLKEEQILFPAMLAGRPIAGITATMRHDHEEHGKRLHRLEHLADGFRPPQDACRSWQALYTGAAKLVDDVMAHVALENNVLFPRFEAAH